MLYLLLMTTVLSVLGVYGECTNIYPHGLDVGIYWAHLTGAGTVEWTKSCPETGELAHSFDPGRNTALWTHGLQPGMVERRERFWLESEDFQFARPWLLRGWNVGIFQWTQLADERLVNFVRAEARIWSPTYFADMRYTYLTAHGDIPRIADAPRNATVADLFLRAYNGHAALLRPDVEMRLIGHSLGAQLVIRAAYMTLPHATRMQRAAPMRVPDRVALLDPVYSPHMPGYLANEACGQTIEGKMGCHIDDLARAGVAIEYYRFSFINKCIFSSQANSDIIRASAFSQPRIHIWGARPLGACYSHQLLSHVRALASNIRDIKKQMANQHIAAVPWYALSLIQPPRRCIYTDAAPANAEGTAPPSECRPIRSRALGAAMATRIVRQWAAPINGTKFCFHQFASDNTDENSPTLTLSPVDDLFYTKACATAHS